MNSKLSHVEKYCSTCHTKFNCGSEKEGDTCWCQSYPAIVSIESDQNCLCSSCLTRLIQKKINVNLDAMSHKEALEMASEYRSTKDKDLIENIDYTIELGNYVFTQWYHLKRGFCCGNGCRHCPY